MAPFDPPSTSTLVLSSPLIFLLRPLYALLTYLRPPPTTRLPTQRRIKVVCISDTHNQHGTLDGRVPEGDILIHAGDLTDGGSVAEIQAAVGWLKSLPHRHKVVVAGNHDGWLDESRRPFISSAPNNQHGGRQDGLQQEDVDWGSIHYLQNSTITIRVGEIRTLTIHGIPQVPRLDDPTTLDSVHAFQYPPDVAEVTASSSSSSSSSPPPYDPPPPSTDILVTHSPAQHHRDVFPWSVGCPHLRRTLWALRPALHVHGHAHAGPPGVERAYYDAAQWAWESLLHRRQEGGELWRRGARGWMWWVFVRGAIWRDATSVFWAWRDAGVVLGGTLWGVLKGWMVEGGNGRSGLGNEGWIVNAACMDGAGSGKLTGRGTVVEI